MFTHEPTMAELFDQLGLASDMASINDFIKTHQLRDDVLLNLADFWTEKQAMFIQEEWRKDAMWAMVLDELNVQLHQSNKTD